MNKEYIIRKVSKKQSIKNNKIAKLKAALPSICVICGCDRSQLDAAHLLPKSIYPEYYTNPLNIVGMCRRCHNLYDNDKTFRQKQKALLEQVKSIDEQAANRYFDII